MGNKGERELRRIEDDEQGRYIIIKRGRRRSKVRGNYEEGRIWNIYEERKMRNKGER